MNWWNFPRKPTVHEQQGRAMREARRLARRGQALSPVAIDGRTIARSFWGKAWCQNLESYRDYEHRLPRGRSYLRSRAVLDLQVGAGEIAALVCGTRTYKVQIAITPVKKSHWERIRTQCGGQVGSLIELLEGRLSEHVMRIITDRADGLFPKPAEIQMNCSCPDWATMCKHVAAAMYGVGARLDQRPELLFTLRKVDHAELIAQAVDLQVTRKRAGRRKTIADDALGSVFGIELDTASDAKPRAAKPRGRASNPEPGTAKPRNRRGPAKRAKKTKNGRKARVARR